MWRKTKWALDELLFIPSCEFCQASQFKQLLPCWRPVTCQLKSGSISMKCITQQGTGGPAAIDFMRMHITRMQYKHRSCTLDPANQFPKATDSTSSWRTTPRAVLVTEARNLHWLKTATGSYQWPAWGRKETVLTWKNFQSLMWNF